MAAWQQRKQRSIVPTLMTPAGLEPAIPGSVGRCLIHWATGPDAFDLLGAHYTERLERRVNLIHPNALYGMELGRQATNMHSVSSVVSFVYTRSLWQATKSTRTLEVPSVYVPSYSHS